jgi:hypothetical protein
LHLLPYTPNLSRFCISLSSSPASFKVVL